MRISKVHVVAPYLQYVFIRYLLPFNIYCTTLRFFNQLTVGGQVQ